MAQQEQFLAPRLTGKRFDDHTIPIELFEDFAVFEELLVEVAKWLYFEENTERKRVPNGFYNDVSLKLAGINEGSAIPALMFAASTLVGNVSNPNMPYYEQAKERIIQAVSAAENNGNITSHIPRHLLVYFNQIGKGLRDDETIDLSPNTNAKAYINKGTRKKLVQASTSTNEILYEMVIVATIPEVDKQKQTFNIIFGSGQKVSTRIPKEHKQEILKAFDTFEARTKVKITGTGRFNDQDRLIGIEVIKHIEILDPLDITARIEELSYLKDGWFNGEGFALPLEFLQWFNHNFLKYYDTTLPLPYLYPMPEGGLQAEWINERYDISVEIPFGGVSNYHVLDKLNNKEIMDEFKLADDSSWQALNNFLIAFLKR